MMKKPDEKPENSISPDDLSKSLCCSETMALSLRQLRTYRALIGDPILPEYRAKTRNEGKRLLQELTQETRELQIPFSSAQKKPPSPFRRLLYERGLKENLRVKRLLKAFPDLPAEEITHYKDILRRSPNSPLEGKALILAEKKGRLLYPGAPVCQDFGNRHFYYASNVMNCIYDCEYCYLKGMYPSDHMVVFVNTADYFSETGALLKEHPVYLCISYDTDLPAIEEWTGLVEEWCAFAAGEKDLTLEIRTKSANTSFFEKIRPLENVIFAFTLSPDPVARAFEHFTPPLSARLSAVRTALEKGFPVRLCFDPMLYVENWQEVYGEMAERIAEEIDLSEIRDASIGTFRISGEYLRSMRKASPDSAVTQYPYENREGVCGYEKSRSKEMTDFLMLKINKYVSREKIFLWK